MLRHDMVETVGKEFLTSNIEAGEYSYFKRQVERLSWKQRLDILYHILNWIFDLKWKTW